MSAEIAFCLIVERGDLEGKAVLLVESLRDFGGRLREAPVWVVQPRPGRPPSRRTLDALSRLDARFVRADLNRAWSDYGPGNKPYAAAFVESLVEGRARSLVLLDSDLIFVGSPEELVLDPPAAVALRPVDQAIVGSPSGDPPSRWWSFLYGICGVDPSDVWNVETTASRQEIRAYFNAGLVAVRPELGLFRSWRDTMDRIAPHRHDREVFPTHRETWFLDQGTLAALVLARLDRSEVRILPPAYNYPLHKQDVLREGSRLSRLEDAVVVHYHDEFHRMAWMDRIAVSGPHRAWLEQRLPLPGLWPRVKRAGKTVAGAVRRSGRPRRAAAGHGVGARG